jgi:predicted oxidoreductase
MGLNTWDTANVYSNGASEILVGKAIKKYNIPRHKVVVLTKCFGAVGEEMGVRSVMWPKEIKASKDYVNNHGKNLFLLLLRGVVGLMVLFRSFTSGDFQCSGCIVEEVGARLH